MRVLYFGTYDRTYPRNAQVISCLRSAGVDVVERHAGVWERRRASWSLGLSGAARVASAETRLILGRKGTFDVMVVGYPGHFDMPSARRIAGRRPLVFNPLVSLEDTLVGDRARFGRRSPGASVLRSVDRIAFRRADLVVADTDAHARFFADRFGLAQSRLATCFVGADDALFVPGWSPPGRFHVLFVGKLIPLHGLETILAAARLLPDVPFLVVGSGQLDAVLERGHPENVEWRRWVDYEELPALNRAAGCALGVFGTGDKARRVIPNKAFQALACGTPLVTGDTPGARELLTDGLDALLVPPGDAEALAAAILRLRDEPGLAERVGGGGRATYEGRASEEALGTRWRALLEGLLAR